MRVRDPSGGYLLLPGETVLAPGAAELVATAVDIGPEAGEVPLLALDGLDEVGLGRLRRLDPAGFRDGANLLDLHFVIPSLHSCLSWLPSQPSGGHTVFQCSKSIPPAAPAGRNITRREDPGAFREARPPVACIGEGPREAALLRRERSGTFGAYLTVWEKEAVPICPPD